MKNLCHVNLPRAGLGNKLLTWAHGVVFAHVNKIELITTGWVSIKIGPLLRREKSLRLYLGYFKQKSLFELIKFHIHRNLYSIEILALSSAQRKLKAPIENKIFVFNKYPDWKDFFQYIRLYRKVILEAFNDLVTDDVNDRVNTYNAPTIGIHIRRGDFKIANNPNLKFSEQSNPLTPEEYFINCIKKLRELYNTSLPVTVFSDGCKEEFQELFKLSDIHMADEDLDIVHLLLLSKSEIIIPSAGSTFSLWASFISDAIIVKHPNHVQSLIRVEDCDLIEGPLENISTIITQRLRFNEN